MKPNTNRSTGNELQRADFLSTLRGKLDKIANVHSKIYSLANDYIAQGFDPSEVEELLTIDGFDKVAVKACLDSIDESPEIVVTGSGKKFGFTVEDVYGRITTNAELNITIFASNEEEALEKAEEFISKADAEKGMERIVDVFEIG